MFAPRDAALSVSSPKARSKTLKNPAGPVACPADDRINAPRGRRCEKQNALLRSISCMKAASRSVSKLPAPVRPISSSIGKTKPEPDGYGYSQFCHLYGQWAKQLKPMMRQRHRAAEKLFIDYAGQT